MADVPESSADMEARSCDATEADGSCSATTPGADLDLQADATSALEATSEQHQISESTMQAARSHAAGLPPDEMHHQDDIAPEQQKDGSNPRQQQQTTLQSRGTVSVAHSSEGVTSTLAGLSEEETWELMAQLESHITEVLQVLPANLLPKVLYL